MIDNNMLNKKMLKMFNPNNLQSLGCLMSNSLIRDIGTAARVFPFRVNNYVVDELIDWEKAPEDPIFQLTFPQSEMLDPSVRARMASLTSAGAPSAEIQQVARRCQMELNPHPAGQMDLNVPVVNGKRVNGMQHKYRETVLFFPSQGQTCHAYCTYCFRWAQFTGGSRLRFSNNNPQDLSDYLQLHPEVTDVLFTGGDPLTMSTRLISKYVTPLLSQKARSGLTTIRFGSKALAYWPYRFLTDPDADDLMRLFEKIVKSGLHLSLMAHFSHPRELGTPAAETAIRRILSTGATIRCQAPLVGHVNDKAEIWREMWKRQVALGAMPYYMFMARNTGPQEYFKVPLARAYEIFTEAYSRVSGLCRTVRGPSMSATPGKVLIDGITEIDGRRVFVLKFIQGRKSQWVNRVFFAEYDENAVWLDDLKPAFGGRRFFFNTELSLIRSKQSTGQKENERFDFTGEFAKTA